MDLFTVFGNLFIDLFHHEIKSHFPGNKVAYVPVQTFGKCVEINFTIAIFDQNII